MMARAGRDARTVQQTEKEFQAAVVEYAQLMGWRVHHVLEQRHYAKRIGAGFPDLVLVKGSRLVFAELKTETGKLSPKQKDWGHALNEVADASSGNVLSLLWRPSDWDWITAVLGNDYRPGGDESKWTVVT